MSLPKKDVRGKIDPEAHLIFTVRAASRGETLEKVISEALNEYALGIGHKDRLAAERLQRAGMLGKGWESQGK